MLIIDGHATQNSALIIKRKFKRYDITLLNIKTQFRQCGFRGRLISNIDTKTR